MSKTDPHAVREAITNIVRAKSEAEALRVGSRAVLNRCVIASTVAPTLVLCFTKNGTPYVGAVSKEAREWYGSETEAERLLPNLTISGTTPQVVKYAEALEAQVAAYDRVLGELDALLAQKEAGL